MRTVTDLKGRSWELEFSVQTYRRLRASLINDLFDTDEKVLEQLQTIGSNRFMLCSVLWEMCRKQANEYGIDEDAFFESWDGGIFSDAYHEVGKAAGDFFPHLRPMISRILEELEETKNQIESELRSTFESIPRGKFAAKDLAGLRNQLSDMRESLE